MNKQILPAISTRKYCLYKKEMPRPNNGPEEDWVLKVQKKNSVSKWLLMVMLLQVFLLIFQNLIRLFLTAFRIIWLAGIRRTCLTWFKHLKKKRAYLLTILKINDSITGLTIS